MTIDRREFLGALALALAPTTLAACAGGSAASGGGRASSPRRDTAEVAGGAALAAVRSFPLGAEVEPAFVFRAAAARPAER
jgi:hypothetical protein